MDADPPTHTPVNGPEPAGGADPVSGPDVLPPVERPSPGFFMQLFFIPLIIVAIIVIVWLMFSWLAHLGTRPEELARDLEKMNSSSWQKALTLANLLRDQRNDELRSDSALAQRLAEALDRQLDEGSMEQHHVRLRIYLCRALGEFQVTDGVGALAKAASTEREPAELDVRRAALQAVALLTQRVDPAELRTQQELMAAIRQAAQEQGDAPAELEARGQLRSTAAYVLGLIGGPPAIDQLVALLGDSYPNTRYNAATGLARHGDTRAIPRLLEMLDPASQGVVQYEPQASDQGWKRELVMISALRASQLLAQANPAADLTELEEAIEELLKTDVGSGVTVQATDALRALKERTSAVPS